MSIRIKIQWLKGDAVAELRDTPTTQSLLKILPLESKAQTWGDEVYFSVPMNTKLESDAEQVVPPGTVGFWTEGNCLAIPFGPTPISVADECRLAARVNLLGKLQGDAKVLASIKPGDTLSITQCK